jgi:hypothetical protein
MTRTLALAAALFAFSCHAEVDVSTLYDVSSEGTSKELKANERGKVVISITAKEGAHVSDEAPLRIELSAKQATLEKQKLTLADSLTKKVEGARSYPNPRFEVAFTPEGKGSASVEAKMTFFICTESQCARQQKTLTLPVTVK